MPQFQLDTCYYSDQIIRQIKFKKNGAQNSKILLFENDFCETVSFKVIENIS